MIQLRSARNYDRRKASQLYALSCKDPSLTKQDQAKDADINTIVRNFGLGKPIPYTARIPTYGDFDQVNDYQAALELVRQSADAFAQLPAKIRDQLGNDPRALVEIASLPNAKDRLLELGLLKPVDRETIPVPTPPAG